MWELTPEEKRIASALFEITHLDAVVTIIKDLREQRVFNTEEEVKEYLLK